MFVRTPMQMIFLSRLISKASLVVLLAGIVAACASAPKVTSTRIIDDVQEFTVDGVQVLLRESRATPVISAVLFIKGGSSQIDTSLPISTEYFAMSIAAGSGTQRTSKANYRNALLRMGTYITGEDGRDFSLLSLRCVRENFDSSWQYFSDVITQPAFDQVEFDNMKHNVLVELGAARNDADRYSRIVADSLFFAGHPYGRHLTTEDVERITLDQIRTHYHSIMKKSRLLLTVVGNISRDELTKKLVASPVTNLSEGSFVEQTLSAPPKSRTPGATLIQFSRKLPTNYAIAYYSIPSKGDSDYYAYVRLRNFFGGFVYNHIRVQHNLAYAPNVDDAEFRTSNGIISFQTGYVDSAVKIIDEDVAFFQDNRIRESAIKEGVGRWTTSNYVKAETAQSQAFLLGQSKLLTGDWRNAFVNYDKLASVTSDQLQRAAQKYLRNFNWVVVGDTTGISQQLLQSR
jgi:zinc protease